MTAISFHLHMVSDSTGETVSSVARAVVAQFDGVEPIEHTWPLVRTPNQINKVLEAIRKEPGFVLYTLSNEEIRDQLRDGCEKMDTPCISVLSRAICDLSAYLGITASLKKPGLQRKLDEDYFSRVEAINFALAHDDGQSLWGLDEADIVLVGVSRTSKSPTSMYLAFRGFRAANVPLVPGVELPRCLSKLKGPLLVGLTISPEILIQVRKNRLLSLDNESDTHYTDFEVVKKELDDAKKLFLKNRWPIIDVTRRSVEETVAKVMQLYQHHKDKMEKGDE
jgi:regulator of PEP synthase PpsR (kinase-PPPase family)